MTGWGVVDPRTRVGDAERDLVLDQLHEQHALGRLSTAELSERVELVLKARTGLDLAMALRDLPELAVEPRSTRSLGASGRSAARTGWIYASASWGAVGATGVVLTELAHWTSAEGFHAVAAVGTGVTGVLVGRWWGRR